MTRPRRRRESQALQALMQLRTTTALQLGSAAVKGERAMRPERRETIGMKLGFRFVRRGIARATRRNLFEWVPPQPRIDATAP